MTLRPSSSVCSCLLLIGCIGSGCIVDRQLGQPEDEGGGDGSATGEPDDDGTSDTDTVDDGGDDSGDSGDPTEGELNCEDALFAPNFTTYWFDLGTSDFHIDIAPITDPETLDLVFASSDWISVWPGNPEQWQDGEAAIVTPGGLPGFTRGLSLGDVTGTDDVDVVVLDNNDFVEVWSGDGSGQFSFEASLGLTGPQSSFNGLLVADLEGDGRDEIIAGLNGGDLYIIHDTGEDFGATVVPTDFQGVDALHAAPWPGPEDPLHLFVGGYDLRGGPNLNLAWAPVDAVQEGWTRAQAPFVHIGDLAVDYRDGAGAPLLVAIEGHPAGFGNLAVTPDLEDLASWTGLSVEDATTESDVEVVGYPAGFDLAAHIGGATVLVDIECEVVQALEGPGIDGALHVADIDGDGLRDLVGRSGTGFAVYSTGT